MNTKEILGFETKNYNNDSVCPNCGYSHILPVQYSDFKLFNPSTYYEYSCSKCGLKWRVKQ